MYTQPYKLNVVLLALFLVASLIESFFVISPRYWWYVGLYSTLATFLGTIIVVYVICIFFKPSVKPATRQDIVNDLPIYIRREIDKHPEAAKGFDVPRALDRIDMVIMLLIGGFGIFVLVYVAYAKAISSRIGWIITLAGLCGVFFAELLCVARRRKKKRAEN